MGLLLVLALQTPVADRLRDAKVTIHVQCATLEEFANVVSATSGIPIEVAPDVVGGPIAVRVEGFSALTLLKTVLRPLGLSLVPRGEGVLIQRRSADELVLRLYDGALLLERVRGVKGTVEPSASGGSLRKGPWEHFPHGMYPQIGPPDPEVGILTYGTVLDVQPVVSHDRRFVTLTVQATHTDLESMEGFPVLIQDFGGSIPPEELASRKKVAIEELIRALWGDDPWPRDASMGWIDDQLVLRHTAAGHRRLLEIAEQILSPLR